MVLVETADTGHAAGICRVGTVSWRDAYADVLPAEYVAANVDTRYDPDRIVDQIDGETDGVGDWLVALDCRRDEAAAAEPAGTDVGANSRVVGQSATTARNPVSGRSRGCTSTPTGRVPGSVPDSSRRSPSASARTA